MKESTLRDDRSQLPTAIYACIFATVTSNVIISRDDVVAVEVVTMVELVSLISPDYK
jgi:hypothetical protein